MHYSQSHEKSSIGHIVPQNTARTSHKAVMKTSTAIFFTSQGCCHSSLMVEIKAGHPENCPRADKAKINHQRDRRERYDTRTVMSAPSPICNTPYTNEIPHTGLISTNAMCFATIVVAWDISISHEHKLLCWFLGIVFVLLRSDQMFLMQQGSH